MISLKTILLTLLTALIASLFSIDSAKEKSFIYNQLDQVLFAEQVIEEEEGTYEVIRIVDGDTIVLFIDNEEVKVRLLGIDTPETVDPRKEVECYGKEATEALKAFLSGQRIRMEEDPTQGDQDRYGRLLRYIYLLDGTHINLEMIRLGFAHEYTYAIPHRFQSAFLEAEKVAAQEKRGLWGDSCQS